MRAFGFALVVALELAGLFNPPHSGPSSDPRRCERLQAATARFLHRLDGSGVRHQRLERQGFLAGHAGQHDAEGVRYGQTHRRQHGARLFLDVLVDPGTDYNIRGTLSAARFASTLSSSRHHRRKWRR
ncbi:hypothetical protein SAMN05216404_108155 [Nitrosospira multiformis]|uniref:Uncharacterized protein n=1 Tax=Nitrosospira multiformis TaxID=1231 RepID=A0A1H8KIU5_9PROT|nr:hypothetical protein SAMN05216404_108155 [Nitrosospira multiformis]